MRRVTGIGGIFFKARDAAALRAWYQRHLGIDVQEWGGAVFPWTDAEGMPAKGTTIRTISAAEGAHFAPSTGSLRGSSIPKATKSSSGSHRPDSEAAGQWSCLTRASSPFPSRIGS